MPVPSNTKKIIIVEDEEIMRQALVDILKYEGFQVLEASDGEMGLELIFREHPDLILLDILMPKMDGMEMMRRLRQTDWGKEVKVFFITNVKPDDKIVMDISQYEPTYYLMKPNLDYRDMVKKIKEELGIT